IISLVPVYELIIEKVQIGRLKPKTVKNFLLFQNFAQPVEIRGIAPADDEFGNAVIPKRPRAPCRKALAEVKGAYYLSDFVFEACFGDRPVDRPLEYDPTASLPCLGRTFRRPWTPRVKTPPSPAPELTAVFDRPPERLRRATPSQLESGGKLFFALPRPDGGEMLGTRIHEFFEAIGRWSDFTPPEDTPPEVLEHYRACAANAELVALFDRPDELWRERPFDVVLRDAAGHRALVTGCFDRVQIARAADGGVERACIIDYKSNQATREELPGLCDHYRPQLASYRAALAALLGVTPNLIECKIVFTRLGEIADV
ncbi:MAG: PD-(D/E)XK nuclease family protein, partial [Lentisphaeria bacterium]|nr:PD-(D/E)XK nuclease family protein [Lentisphaeria bacterium]